MPAVFISHESTSMPIHLTPLQRRTFLQTTLGAGASLLTFNAILADETEAEIEHVSLLADTHVDAVSHVPEPFTIY